MKDVVVVMGSSSDYAVMSSAVAVLNSFSVEHDCIVVSAHRTPNRLYEFATGAHANYKVVIAGAGGAAHLPGMIASMTLLPVLGVPIALEPLHGLDSMLSIVQMPRGVPVGTLAIGGATNAALLALRILSLSDSRIQDALRAYQKDLADSVPSFPQAA